MNVKGDTHSRPLSLTIWPHSAATAFKPSPKSSSTGTDQAVAPFLRRGIEMNSNRIRDIDFWRGAVLIAILIDHIPGNPLENWTPRNFGLSDSAEAFVFLSGLSVGLIYLPRAFKYGLEPVAGGCLKRALKLYGVHIALTVAALVVFGAAYWASGVPDLIQAHGRAFVFGSPGNGLLGLALLSHQLGYFNILPLYIVLMLWAPVAVALALRGPLLALTVSIGLYAAARAFDLNLPNWPEPGGWFFNPIAWQLVFTLGLVSAILWRDGLPRPAPWLLALSAVTVAGRRADRHQRRRPRAWAARHGDRASRRRQAGSWSGAPDPLRRIGLSDCDGDRVRAIYRAGGQGRFRQCGSKSRPQQPVGFRRRFVLERLRSGRVGGRFTARVCRG